MRNKRMKILTNNKDNGEKDEKEPDPKTTENRKKLYPEPKKSLSCYNYIWLHDYMGLSGVTIDIR